METKAMLKTETGGAGLAEHQQALYLLLTEFDRVCKALDIKYFLFAGTLLGAVRHKGFIPWDDDLDVIMLRADYERFMRQAPTVLDNGRFCLQAEFTKHWPIFYSKLRINGTTCLEKYHPKDKQMHQGVYMDIFPCDYGAKTPAGRKMQFYASKVVIAKSLDRLGYETNSIMKKAVMLFCRALPLKPFLWLTKRGSESSGYLHSFLGGASKFHRSVYPAACFAEREMMDFESGSFPAPADFHTLLGILYDDYMSIPPEEDRKYKKHAFFVDLEKSYEEYAHIRDGMTFEFYTKSIR